MLIGLVQKWIQSTFILPNLSPPQNYGFLRYNDQGGFERLMFDQLKQHTFPAGIDTKSNLGTFKKVKAVQPSPGLHRNI